jgi:hypothetical protein
MPSPEAAPRIVGRLFRADGDHITDLKIPLSTRPRRRRAVAFPRVPVQGHRSIAVPGAV